MNELEVKLSFLEKLGVIFSMLKSEIPWKKIIMVSVFPAIGMYLMHLDKALPWYGVIVAGTIFGTFMGGITFLIYKMIQQTYNESIAPKYRYYESEKKKQILSKVDDNFISRE